MKLHISTIQYITTKMLSNRLLRPIRQIKLVDQQQQFLPRLFPSSSIAVNNTTDQKYEKKKVETKIKTHQLHLQLQF